VAKQPAPGKETDPEFFWGLVLGCLLLMAVISYFWEYIARPLMMLRYYEASFLDLLPGTRTITTPVFEWLANTDTQDAKFSDIVGSGELMSTVLKWPFLIVTGLIGYRLGRKKYALKIRYAQRHTKATLAPQEGALWPIIKPVLGKHLENVPLTDPIEGMRQLPREWCYKNNLLLPYSDALLEDASVGEKHIIHDEEILLVDKAKAVLEKTLGRRWDGFDALLRHEKSLFVGFCSQIADLKTGPKNDISVSLMIFNELADQFCIAEKERNIQNIYSETAERIAYLFTDFGSTGDIEKDFAKADSMKSAFEKEDIQSLDMDKLKTVLRLVTASHAYVRTVLMTLILLARKNGKLPPSWFRWLKTTDRITWYSLNDLGLAEEDMPSSIDAAGIRSHWLWERRSRTALIDPHVEQAIPGLIQELETRCAESNDEEDLLAL